MHDYRGPMGATAQVLERPEPRDSGAARIDQAADTAPGGSDYVSTACPDVRLRLIGGFELEIDGEPIELQPAVQRLTAFVALTPRGVARDFAAFQLWPDKCESRAKANLRSTLWRLNQLGAEVVAVSATRLRLGAHVWLDTLGWLHTASSADTGHLAVPPPFHTMLPDLLPDWYDEWLLVERERFRQLNLNALERHARVAMSAGDAATAIQFALAALAIEGSRESAHQLVVDAHLSEGNASEAERERARYRRCLAQILVDHPDHPRP